MRKGKRKRMRGILWDDRREDMPHMRRVVSCAVYDGLSIQGKHSEEQETGIPCFLLLQVQKRVVRTASKEK